MTRRKEREPPVDPLAVTREELEVALDELQALRREQQGSVPLTKIHEWLDATGAPRRGLGRLLFVQERIKWCARAINGREIE